MSILQIGRLKKAFPKLHQRLYLSISSEGYGHSSRALAIARQFQENEILIGTYSYALDRVQRFGYPSIDIPQEVKFVGDDGSFDVGKTILENSSWVLNLNQIIQEEMNIMREYGLSLVVADGRISPVLAASRLDIPCVVVTNQSAFYPFFAQDSPLVKMFGKSFDWVMKLWLSSAEEILIPDFPPPYTVCLPNLSDNFQVKKRTRFVGPLVCWQAHEVETYKPDMHPEKPRIVVSLGGHAYRKPLFDTVLKAAERLPHLHFEILTSFTTKSAPDNVTIHGVVKDCAPFFKAAELVITQAGHSTAMELLTLGKPALIVPDNRQIEQENNARRMVELNVAEKIEYDQLNVRTLTDTLNKMLETDLYRSNAEVMAQRATEIHGAAQAANVLREYANRLLAY